MQPVGSVACQPCVAAIQHRARDVVASTRRTYVATALRLMQTPRWKALSAVAGVIGHLPFAFPRQEKSRGRIGQLTSSRLWCQTAETVNTKAKLFALG